MALYLIAFNDEWTPDLTLEEVRERGTHAQLLAQGGLYSRLYHEQFESPSSGEPELAAAAG